ncbi:MAG TPA: hypothetical protein VJ065_03025 [Patescibacteria group bacterium]|nr:hypothetical protein [Patescibacteria group bacterium]
MEQKDREKTDYDRHLKSSSTPEKTNDPNTPTDAAPNYGGTVFRSRGGEIRSTEIVAQSGFDDEGESIVKFQTNTGGTLKSLTPIEEEGRQSTHGFIPPETTRRAIRQKHAINTNNAGRRKK